MTRRHKRPNALQEFVLSQTRSRCPSLICCCRTHIHVGLQCCSEQSDNCRSTTVPHSTHSRISQQALQSKPKQVTFSSVGENFTQLRSPSTSSPSDFLTPESFWLCFLSVSNNELCVLLRQLLTATRTVVKHFH